MAMKKIEQGDVSLVSAFRSCLDVMSILKFRRRIIRPASLFDPRLYDDGRLVISLLCSFASRSCVVCSPDVHVVRLRALRIWNIPWCRGKVGVVPPVSLVLSGV